MATWIVKAALQKAISLMPYKHSLNYLLQRFVTRSTVLDDSFFEIKVRDSAAHADYFERFTGRSLEGATALELGTGWYPIVPVGLYLRGADVVHSVDYASLTDAAKVRTTFRFFVESAAKGSLTEMLPAYLPERIERLAELLRSDADLDALLGAIGMRLTVADARRLPLPEGSVDLIVSNNTFEHIPLDVLHAILAEFRRILSPTGLMSHFIDLSDHFAHFDRAITLYNFLQYSDRAWRIINNSIVPLNRLRIAEYRRLFAEEGFTVIHEERTLGSEEALARVRLAPQFRQYPKEDLLVTHCRMISVDARRGAQAAA